MRHLDPTAMTRMGGVMEELEATRLAEVAGGALIVGDGFCGTPVPRPPIPWTAPGSDAFLYSNPAVSGPVLGLQQGG
jgi:hypothetical protein